MSRSTAALIIAVLFHLLIILLFWLLGIYFAEHPVISEKPKEQRIKVALKELPKSTKNAALKNKVPPAKKIPPMPKGSQLEKIVPASESKPLPKPKEQIPVKPPVPEQPQQKIPTPKKIAKPKPPKPKVEPVPSEKPYIPFMKAPQPEPENRPEQAEQNRTAAPKKHSRLFAKLSKKQVIDTPDSKAVKSYKREGRIPQDIREAYGDSFGKLSEGEQKYLLDNQEIMRRLTQTQLNHTGSVMIPNTLRVNDDNIVEFYLHPDGSMTDFKFIKRSNFFLLDDVTKDTIESVYWKYPRPKQKTLVRYKFGYYLRGY